VHIPPSIEINRLASSGRTVEVEAQAAIDERRFFNTTPESTILPFGFSGSGRAGKSS
jgi:hypothetical protein